ncbi:MAG: hypothetical protein HQK98_04520 [Nitrospirae bacterium]|nr:hypothetical protein [Nitrospirota bacterium]
MPCKTFINDYPGFKHCILCDSSDEGFHVEENNKEFIINNISKKRFMVIEIDGCIIKKEQKKCDYLFINCNESKFYFVELKGRNVPYAVKQILATLDKFKTNEFYKKSESVNAYIVTSRKNPNVISSERNDVDTELGAKKGRLYFSEFKYVLDV